MVSVIHPGRRLTAFKAPPSQTRWPSGLSAQAGSSSPSVTALSSKWRHVPRRSRGVGAGWAASTCLVSLVAEGDHDAGGQARDRDRRDGHVRVAVHRQHPVNGVDVAAAARAETRTGIYATNDGPYSTSGRRGQHPHTWYQVARE